MISPRTSEPRSPIVPASEAHRAAHPIAQGIRSRIRLVLVSIRISARPRKRYWRSSGSLGSTARMRAGMLASGFPIGYARLMRRDKSPGFSSMMAAIVPGFVSTSRTFRNSTLMVDVKCRLVWLPRAPHVSCSPTLAAPARSLLDRLSRLEQAIRSRGCSEVRHNSKDVR